MLRLLCLFVGFVVAVGIWIHGGRMPPLLETKKPGPREEARLQEKD